MATLAGPVLLAPHETCNHEVALVAVHAQVDPVVTLIGKVSAPFRTLTLVGEGAYVHVGGGGGGGGSATVPPPPDEVD